MEDSISTESTVLIKEVPAEGIPEDKIVTTNQDPLYSSETTFLVTLSWPRIMLYMDKRDTWQDKPFRVRVILTPSHLSKCTALIVVAHFIIP